MKLLKYIIISLLFMYLISRVFTFVDTGQFSSNYRIPINLGEDYFLYKIYCEYISSKDKIIVLGDSTIWGHYSKKGSTLTAQFNNIAGRDLFSNLGIDGIHPAAMYGLIKYFGRSIRNKKIIIGINLLWMSSPRHDLTGEKNNEINHKKLLPQFYPSVPAYNANLEERTSLFLKRSISFFTWIDHIKQASFADTSFYRWTMENPYSNPLAFFTKKNAKKYSPPAIIGRAGSRQNVDWISTEKSFQWSSMVKTLDLLKSKENSILALITPFNLHMLTKESGKKYSALLSKIINELGKKEITYIIPETLKKELYADASHPNIKGYKVLAENISKNKKFIRFISE